MRLTQLHAVISEELALDPDVSFTAKGLYAYLMALRHPESQTVKGITMTMRESEDVVRGALRELEAKGYIDGSDAGHALEKPQKLDKRDPEVTELAEYFEATMDLKMPRPQYQRRAAKTLIQKVGLEVAKRAVDAAKACSHERYAPRVLSLEDLRDKWNGLVDFYRRSGHQVQERREKTEQIHKMTGTT